MRNFVITCLRTIISWFPTRVKGVLFEYCLAGNIEGARLERLLPDILRRLNLVEIAAAGDLGVVSSSAKDDTVLFAYARNGTFFPEVKQEFLNFFAPEGGTFIDIGANIGLSTIAIARNPQVRCLAFEPEPDNFSFLKRNIIRNVDGNEVACHQVALFERRCVLTLAVTTGNIGDHRLNLGISTGRQTIEVQAVPLDDFLGQVTGPLAVKIDAQGAEPYIVAGGRQVLARAGLIAMEFCPYLMRQLDGDIQVVLDLIATFPFVSVTPGDRIEQPIYLSTAEALEILREKIKTCKNEGDYLDILARRTVVQ